MKYIIVDRLWIRKFDLKKIITKIKKKLMDFDEIITKNLKKI
jgi:spore coat polysaccharide biosynthesis predicted glycosyltransferase SpsG